MPDTVQLIDPTGRARDVPLDEAAGLLTSGWHQQTSVDASRLTTEAAREQDYGGATGAAKAALYGGARGVSLGLSDILFRGLGAAPEDLRGYQQQNPLVSLGAEIIGGIAPSFAAPGSLLTKTPAGAVTGLGKTIVESAEGAGVVAKAGLATAGAAVEGAGFGGGLYLSQVALDDKPLAAEGFIGAMGHGALFAAPIGGALSLGQSTLLRARSLFPQQTVTREAALGVKQQATSEIGQSVADGDQMAQAIQRKIELTDAKIGMAETGERVTRRMFGDADQLALGDQVAGAVDKTQLAAALQKYQASRAQLSDWLRHEADPDLDAALSGLVAPEVGEIGGRIDKRAGKMFEPEIAAGTPVNPDQRALNEALDMRSRQVDVTRVGKRPANDVVPEELLAGVGKQADSVPQKQHSDPQFSVVRKKPSDKELEDAEFYTSVWHTEPGPKSLNSDEFSALEAAASKSLTRAESDAVYGYSTDRAYAINKELRTNSLSEKAQKYVAHLDAALAKSTLPSEARVFRGIKAGTNTRRVLEDIQVGDEMTDLGYMSTAATPESARGFANERDLGGAIMVIDVPKGHRGVAIAGDSPAEREILLPRGTKLKVVKSEIRTDAVNDLGDLIPPERVVHFRIVDTGSTASANAPADDLLSQLQGTAAKLDEGKSIGQIGASAPARAEYVAAKAAKRGDDAAYFGAKAKAPPDDLLAALQGTKQAIDQGASIGEVGRVGKSIVDHARLAADDGTVVGRALSKRAGKNIDIGPDLNRAAKAIGDHESALADMAEALGSEAPVTAVARAKAFRSAVADQADVAAMGFAKTAQDIKTKVQPQLDMAPPVRPPVPSTRTMFGGETVVDNDITKALRRHDAQTPPSPRDATAVDSDIAKALRAHDAKASAKLAPPTAPTQPSGSVLGKLADVGTALEVLQAMGVHTPDISKIPVIGPVLSLFLKARAVMSILGRKGGSIPRSTEGLVAQKSSETRNRINAATTALLETGARGARKAASFSAGPAVLLGTRLFPGGDETKSKDARKLYEARVDELARAQAPGAIAAAIGDRIRTSDPVLLDAIVAQIERGLRFIDSKAPKQTVSPSMIPGDGVWHPSKVALEEWGRYIHAVNDPASVIEDLAKGHISMEGAETLRVVYPALFAEAQRLLLEAAPKMQQTMSYSKRVAISIMYRVPVDDSMTSRHMQFLQPPPEVAAAQQGMAPSLAGPPPTTPALTAPLQIGQQTMSPLDRRAGE